MAQANTIQQAQRTTTRSERGVCSGCGDNGRTLQAPHPNAGRGYEGPMYCRGCNPRFRGLDSRYFGLEGMGL